MHSGTPEVTGVEYRVARAERLLPDRFSVCENADLSCRFRRRFPKLPDQANAALGLGHPAVGGLLSGVNPERRGNGCDRIVEGRQSTRWLSFRGSSSRVGRGSWNQQQGDEEGEGVFHGKSNEGCDNLIHERAPSCNGFGFTSRGY